MGLHGSICWLLGASPDLQKVEQKDFSRNRPSLTIPGVCSCVGTSATDGWWWSSLRTGMEKQTSESQPECSLLFDRTCNISRGQRICQTTFMGNLLPVLRPKGLRGLRSHCPYPRGVHGSRAALALALPAKEIYVNGLRQLKSIGIKHPG